MNNIIRKKKNILKALITMGFIGVLGIVLYIIGTLDYIRAMNDKKPIFTYHTVNVSNLDITRVGFEDTLLPNVEGTIYYGIGYNISICDNDTGNYIFGLGHKQKESCFTSLTCTQIDDLNIKKSFEYSFFDGKLYLINQTHIVPIENTDQTEEEFELGIMKLNDIKGCSASFKKINDTYEVVEICNLFNMSDGDIYEVYQTYHSSLEQTKTTKDEIIDYYDKWMVCK